MHIVVDPTVSYAKLITVVARADQANKATRCLRDTIAMGVSENAQISSLMPEEPIA